MPAGTDEVPELIPYDAGARKVMELTFRKALRLGHNYAGTGHILPALLESEDGAGVLTGLGIGKEAASAAIVTALEDLAESRAAAPAERCAQLRSQK